MTEECPICYNNLSIKILSKNYRIDLKCNHYLCMNCLSKIIKKNNSYKKSKCAICRQNILINDILINLFYKIYDDYIKCKYIHNWSSKDLLKLRLCSIYLKKFIIYNYYRKDNNQDIQNIIDYYNKDYKHLVNINKLYCLINIIDYDYDLYYLFRKDDRLKIKLCKIIVEKYIKYYKNNYKLHIINNEINNLKINYNQDFFIIISMYDEIILKI